MGGIHNDKVAIFFAALPVARDVTHNDKNAISFASLPVERNVPHDDKNALYPSLRFPLHGMCHTMTRSPLWSKCRRRLVVLLREWVLLRVRRAFRTAVILLFALKDICTAV
jgi:hypothetical protein